MALASSSSSVFGSLSGLVNHSSSTSGGSRNADGVPLETQQAIFEGQLRISCVGSQVKPATPATPTPVKRSKFWLGGSTNQTRLAQVFQDKVCQPSVAMAAAGFTTPTCLASSSLRRPSAAFSTEVCFVARHSVHFKIVRADLRKERLPKVACIVGMAPDDEKMTRRSPLDFPVEWDRPTPGRRPDIFPQFSPMKTPLPPPLPTDPPEEDEEEEEEKKEEDPDKEDKPVE